MRRIDLLSGIFGCLIFLVSCSPNDIGVPNILFIYPEMSSYHDMTTDLNVEIDISDDIMVQNYRFWIDGDNGFELFKDEKVIKESSFKILYEFDFSNINSNEIFINLEVFDSDGNQSQNSVKVHTKK